MQFSHRVYRIENNIERLLNGFMMLPLQYAKIIQKLGFEASFKEFKIQNIVGSCDVRFPIRLEGLAFSHQLFANVSKQPACVSLVTCLKCQSS